MAQETAGTIGIPVLKNELLPYLTDYAKRSERAELYKQKAQQRAAELAAKKAAEDAKYVPKFESSRGGMFSHVTQKRADERIKAALDIFKDPNTPTQSKMLVSNEANRMNLDDADLDKQLEAKIVESAKDLKNRYRRVDIPDAYAWAKTQTDYKSPEEFAKAVRSNPDLIDFDAIGKKAKDYQQQQYSYRGPGAETRQISISPLFEYKMEKDPVVGTEVPVVTGINGVEAQKLIESDQDMKEAFDVFVKNRAELNKSKTYIDPQTGSPIMLRPEIAEQKAAEEFMNNAFGKYGKVKYGQSFQMPRKPTAAPKPEETTQMVEAPITATVYQNVVNPQKGQPTQMVVDVNLGVGANVTLPKNRKVQVGANRKVYVLGGDVSKAVQAGILKPSGLPDGSYILNYGFDVQTYQKPKSVYRLTKDYDFAQKTGGTIRYKAGTILDINKVNLLKKAGATNAYTQIQKPIRISPGTYQARIGEDDDVQYKAPIMRGLDLIISESEIPDLKSAEESKQKAVSSGGPLDSW
jgi:hypothetical protein